MLNLNLNLGWAVPGFSWGRLRLVCGGVGAEVEVESMATAAWVDRLRSHAGERGLVFLAVAAGAVAWGEQCRSVCLSGGGRKAAVPLGDTAWSSTSTSTSTSTLALAGSAGAVAWGERCRSLGRQEAVAKRPYPWRTQPGAQPQPRLDLARDQP